MGDYPEDQVEREAKRLLMEVPPAVMAVERVLRLRLKADAGFVVWDAASSFASGCLAKRQAFDRDKFSCVDSFFDALTLALAFCETDMRNEWVLLGAVPLKYVRMMDRYQHIEPVECHPLVYIGTMQGIALYVPKTECSLIVLDPNRWYAGTDRKAAQGMISNAPCAMTRNHENTAV